MNRGAVALAFAAAAVFAALPVRAVVAPADEYYPYQWGMTQINAVRAWEATQGNSAVVAVIDTGVAPDHPDLPRVLDGFDLIDDDGDASDENGHGTLIAGIISAATNRIGVAGVAPNARILPIRVLGADGTGDASDVARGIDVAIDEGAHVINLSLAEVEGTGGLIGGLMRAPEVDNAIRRAASAGITVIVASGNDHEDGGSSPTAYDATVKGVLVVGATTRASKRAAYSNYGKGLDLLAPGGGEATDPSDAGCDEKSGIVSTWWDPAHSSSVYGAACGTSMSVAFVSGVAALLHSTGLENVEITDRIVSTAKDLGAPGRDDQTGVGVIDAAAALGVRVGRPTPAATKRGSVTSPRSPTPTLSAAAPRPTGVSTVPPLAIKVRTETSSRSREIALSLLMMVAVSLGHAARAASLSRSGTGSATRWPVRAPRR